MCIVRKRQKIKTTLYTFSKSLEFMCRCCSVQDKRSNFITEGFLAVLRHSNPNSATRRCLIILNNRKCRNSNCTLTYDSCQLICAIFSNLKPNETGFLLISMLSKALDPTLSIFLDLYDSDFIQLRFYLIFSNEGYIYKNKNLFSWIIAIPQQ